MSPEDTTSHPFRFAVDLSPTPMLVVDEAGTILHANGPIERLTGWPVGEIVGRSIEVLVPERMREGHDRMRTAFAENPHPRHMGEGRTLSLLHRDGTEIPTEIGLNPVRVGSALRVVTSLVDLRPRRRAEQRFAAAVESSPSGMIMVDARGMVVLVNREAERLFGYSRDELIGQPLERLIPERSRTIHPGLRQEFHRSPQARPMGAGRELYGHRKDGSEVPVEIGLNPVETEEGTFVLASIVDLTARRKAERELRETEERFRVLIEGVRDYAIVMLDAGGHVVSWNTGAERITGFRAEDALHRQIGHLGPDDEAAREMSKEALRLAVAQGRHEDEGWSRRKDGTRFLAHTLITALPGDSGRVRGFAMVMRDVTAQRQLEDHLRQSQKLEAVGTLAGGIAHDFNNILAAILGYAEVMKRELAGHESALHDLEQVLIAAERGRQLVQRLLTFSRPQPLSGGPTSVAPAVEEAMRLIRAALPSTIEVRTTIAPNTPPVYVDGTELQQILMNLATNAAHAMGGTGSIAVSAEPVYVDTTLSTRHPGLRQDQHVRLRVHDDGQGMSPDVRDRVFEPFFTTKPIGQGTGLGLAVVHGIVQSHRGAIEIQSAPGAGTTIEILLPAARLEEPPPRTQQGELPRGRGEHVLLVDDEPQLAAVLARQLEELGYRVTVHTSSPHALGDLRRNAGRFDLVLSDLTMPIVTGLAIAEEAARLRPELSVLLMSGFAGGVPQEQLEESSVRGLLAKPVMLSELATAVRAALQPR